MQNIRTGRWLVAMIAATLLGTAACASVAEGIGDTSEATLYGEVRSVDTRRGWVQLRDERSGRTETVRYDGRTRVVYRQRSYPVSALERGDRVRVRVVNGRGGDWWAERIEVEENVREGGRSGYVQRLDGTVTQVDVRRGVFAVQQGRGSYVVYVPDRVSRDDERRFTRLRRGERVRVDVRDLGRGRAELVRFR